MPSNIKLSVVIPAYNEAARIAQTLEATDQYLRKQNYGYEIIVVDNGSNDNTCDIVKEYQERLSRNLVRLCLSKSIGAKGSAVKMGILNYAQGDFVVFMDADNASPISEIEKFWSDLESGEYQVIIGSRYVNESDVTQRQPLYRVILSRMSNLLIQALLVRGVRDTQLGFKAFSRLAAKDIFSQVTVPGWGFDMEVLTIALRHGYRIKEVGVLWHEQGGSHVPLRAYIQSLKDLLKIKINSIFGRYNKK